MKKITVFLCFFNLLLLTTCSPSAEEIDAKEKAKADSVALSMSTEEQSTFQEAPAPDAEPSENKEIEKQEKKAAPTEKTLQTGTFYDSVYLHLSANRKLIKNANLTFKVQNVQKATLSIENLAHRYGGFTLKSDIVKTTSYKNTIRINSDSVMEIGICNIENNMIVRVPQFLLDTMLYKIGCLWTDLDERTVEAEDVTINYLGNELRAKIHQKTATNINKATQKGGKLDDVVEAERTANQFLESSIQNQIDNLSLQDRVDYATITMRFYQDEVLYKRKIASYDIEDYDESFGSRFTDSLMFGWKIILGFILFLTKCWSIVLISVVIFLIVFYFVKWMVRLSHKRDKNLE